MSAYDWTANAPRWAGMLQPGLRKLLKTLYPDMVLDDDAAVALEQRLYLLLSRLCAVNGSLPRTIQACAQAVEKLLPKTLASRATHAAEELVAVYNQTKKRSAIRTDFPVDKIHTKLNREVLCDTSGGEMGLSAALFIIGVLDFVAADVLTLAADYTKNTAQQNVTAQSLNHAIDADELLGLMFEKLQEPVETTGSFSQMSYKDLVREAFGAEEAFLNLVQLINVVFAELFESHIHTLFSEDDVQRIFAPIRNMAEVTQHMASSLESALEVAEPHGNIPGVGGCYLDMTSEMEHKDFMQYANDIGPAREHLAQLVALPPVREYFNSIGPSCLLAVQYELPALLVEPLYHYRHHVETVEKLIEKQQAIFSALPNHEVEQLQDALFNLLPAAKTISPQHFRFMEDRRAYIKLPRLVAQHNQAQCRQVQNLIEGWTGPDLSTSVTILHRQGWLALETEKHKTERYVFAFDGMVLCVKENSVQAKAAKYRYKEHYLTRGMTAQDLPDAPAGAYRIQITTADNVKVVFQAKNAEDKVLWLTALARPATTRWLTQRNAERETSMESELSAIFANNRDSYVFWKPDSPDNIRFEEGMGSVPEIKGGTLEKLVERLTYPQYADPTYVRYFMTTYRSFCTAQELLRLLIKRFDVPEPKSDNADLRRRFAKLYTIPVRLRVINVLKHWVDVHFYDFERDKELLKDLLRFTRDVLGKDSSMRKACKAIVKGIKKNQMPGISDLQVVWGQNEIPPVHLWLPTDPPTTFHLLTLHPVEIARQMTLIDSKLYRAIQPSELVGLAWSKRDKHLMAAHVLGMINRSTAVSNWLVRCILECADLTERSELVACLCEVLRELRELNNFDSIMTTMSALRNAAIYRLKHTWAEVPPRQMKVFEACDRLLGGTNLSNLRQELARVNPPCIPFFGMYLTDITFIEEGSSDFLLNGGIEGKGEPQELSQLINFGKRRLVARTTRQIQLYQNQPYCLAPEPAIQKFLMDLPSMSTTPIPLPPMESPTTAAVDQFHVQSYDLSLKLEPRGLENKADLISADRLFPDPRLIKARQVVLTNPARSRGVGELGRKESRKVSTSLDSDVSSTAPSSPAVDTPPVSTRRLPPPLPLSVVSPVSPAPASPLTSPGLYAVSPLMNSGTATVPPLQGKRTPAPPPTGAQSSSARPPPPLHPRASLSTSPLVPGQLPSQPPTPGSAGPAPYLLDRRSHSSPAPAIHASLPASGRVANPANASPAPITPTGAPPLFPRGSRRT